ncbi:MAG TPA: hypothetical protein GX517_02215 [Alicyclobacillus sp.]|nr:hypothetical protein [Alicyclobacillus sp.]
MSRTSEQREKGRRPIPKQRKPAGKGNKLNVSTQQRIEELHQGKIDFSFIYLDLEHEAFNCGGTEVGWFRSLFEILGEISRMKRNEFRVQSYRRFRIHSHNWDKAAYKFNLPDGLMEQLEEDKCIQFGLSKANGRVHGFLIDNVFYVVWLDPHHNLYPMERHGGLKLYERPVTPYEELLYEHESLKERYRELEEDRRELWEMLNDLTKPDVS